MSGDIPMIHGYEEQHGDERGNDKFDEATWAELARLREETRWHVELRITTRCPSCGHQSLFIGKGGHLTCSWLECKEPGLERAIEKLASAPSAPQPEIARAAFMAGVQARQLQGINGAWSFPPFDPVTCAESMYGEAFGQWWQQFAERTSETPTSVRVRHRDHHVWREKHGRTCVCGAKEGDPEPCRGPSIIGRD